MSYHRDWIHTEVNLAGLCHHSGMTWEADQMCNLSVPAADVVGAHWTTVSTNPLRRGTSSWVLVINVTYSAVPVLLIKTRRGFLCGLFRFFPLG
jgi:hypothetical protein